MLDPQPVAADAVASAHGPAEEPATAPASAAAVALLPPEPAPAPAPAPEPVRVVAAEPEPEPISVAVAVAVAVAVPEPEPAPVEVPPVVTATAEPVAATIAVTPVITPVPVDIPTFAVAPVPRPRRVRPTVPRAPLPHEAFGRWNSVAAGVVLALAVVMRIAGGGPAPVAGGAPPAPTVATAEPAAASRPSASAAKAAAGEPRVRVIIVSEDGMRRDVLNDRYAPRHTALMREGIVARRALTISHTETLPSHASMLSGVGPEVHGMKWNTFRKERGFIDVPTVFSVARAHGLSTAMIIGKKKLEHLAKPGTVDHYERPSHYCKKVSARAAEYFVEQKPDIMFVHFSDPDDAGHSKGWMTPAYLQAVKNSDKCLAHLLAAVDASGLGESTMVIVTADHGGHDRTHSNGVRHREVDQVIPWIVRGPGIAPGGILDDQVDTIDTAVTALSALRLPASGMAGVSHLPALLAVSAPATLR